MAWAGSASQAGEAQQSEPPLLLLVHAPKEDSSLSGLIQQQSELPLLL